jgi:hypothetical protein
MQQVAMTVRDHSNSQSDQLSIRRIGADNDRVSDSFDLANMGNTIHSHITGDIASGNADLIRTFNRAQMGNTVGPDMAHIQGRLSHDTTVYSTTVASNNRHLQDAFEGAMMGNTTATQSSVFIASGNRDITQSFNGARFGNVVGADT